MKNILLATDLSIASTGVTGYAAWLAALVGARLTLMSAYRLAPVFAGSSIPEMPEDSLPELIQCRLEETAARLGAEYRIAIDVLARSGDPVRGILAAARDIHADLIVVGKAGAGHMGKSMPALAGKQNAGQAAIPGFGATVVALARKTTIPLLIVPQAANCVAPKAIAVTKELLSDGFHEALRDILGRFGCRLYRFGVKTKTPGEIVEVHRAEAIHSAGEQYHLLYEIPVDDNLRHSMENFIEVAPIYWLAVRPLAGLAPERWVLSGRNKALAFDIRVPLLVLPDSGPFDPNKGYHRNSVN